MRYMSRPSLDPAERLLLGIPPERALDITDPRAWRQVDRDVRANTARLDRYAPPDAGPPAAERDVRRNADRPDRDVRRDPGPPAAEHEPSAAEHDPALHPGGARRPDWSAAPRWDTAARPPGVTWSADPPTEAELALGLCHHDPRVREDALGFAAARPRLHPLVLFRCADGVARVRARAREALAEAAGELSAGGLSPGAADLLLPLALLLTLRPYGGWGWDFVTARLDGPPDARIRALTASGDRELREAAVRMALRRRLLPAATLEALVTRAAEYRIRHLALTALLRDGPLPAALAEALVTGSPDVRIRRTALDHALREGLLPARRLAGLAGHGPDPEVRRRCLAAALATVGTDDPAGVLDVLAASSSAVLRSSAVTALHRVGRGAAAGAFLGDPSARVRSAARLVLRLEGEDPAAHYLARCADPTAPGLAPGLALGLAESGAAGAAGLLRRMAAHPEGRVRAKALAALRMADAVSPDELMAFMADPHPPVVRVARKALVPYVLLLPEPWLAGLVAPGRPRHTRRAGLRLLSAHGLDLRKRVLAPLEDDEDPEVRYEAQRARYEQRPPG